MLHQETLLLLNFFARRAHGPVLEIGPYTGGSTIAIARGLKDRTGTGLLVTIEAGGAYAHPQLPSADIIADLRKNLTAFGTDRLVRVIQGWSDRRAAIKASRRMLARETIDLFVIDGDGHVGRDFWIYEPLLSDNCVLVFDDYEGETEKTKPVSNWVKRATARGLVTDLGVYLWGTWVGQYRRPGWISRAAYRFLDAPLYLPEVASLTARTRIPIWRAKRWIAGLRGERVIGHAPGGE
jgi:predicted O-methyltransferase YrrM